MFCLQVEKVGERKHFRAGWKKKLHKRGMLLEWALHVLNYRLPWIDFPSKYTDRLNETKRIEKKQRRKTLPPKQKETIRPNRPKWKFGLTGKWNAFIISANFGCRRHRRHCCCCYRNSLEMNRHADSMHRHTHNNNGPHRKRKKNQLQNVSFLFVHSMCFAFIW